MVRRSLHLSIAGTNQTVASTMSEQELSFAPLASIGMFHSACFLVFMHFATSLTSTSLRIKEKLRSGEMHVRGDQWPIFLYADLAYDRDDPWHGLLRSQLLVSVSLPQLRL